MPARYRFGDFALDVDERSLTRCGADNATPVRVPLQPKTFDLLAHLVTHAGRLHTKQALLDEVWGDVVVTENSLTQSIHQLRTALDDTAQQSRYVETVPRAGYRFIAAVAAQDASPPAAPQSEPQVATRRIAAYVIAAVLGVAAVYFVADRWRQHTASIGHTPSVAVLPFKNLGNDPDNEAFADGVPDTLLTMLAQIRQLRVIGRTSSFSFREKEIDVRTIGAALGADAVLEGSVQRSGERIRINAQLISAVDGMHLWAENFERPITDIFAVQDEIAQRVAEALKITLAGKLGPGSAGTQNFEAYQLNLEAKQLLRSRQSANVDKALPKLQRAVELDPNYGDAWVGLAEAYGSSGLGDESLRAIRRALEVAPETAGPHLMLGYWLMHSGGDGAAAAMARGLELAPQDPETLTSVAAEYRMRAGRYADSAALMRRAAKLDPRNSDVLIGAAWALEANGELSAALAQIREVLRLEPGMGFAYYVAGGMLFGELGRMDEALRFIRRARILEPTYPRLELIVGYALLGEDERATREIETERSILQPENLIIVRAHIDLLAGRVAEAHALIDSALAADPSSTDLLTAIDEFGIASAREDAQRVLDRLLAVDPDWLARAAKLERYPPICSLAWSGDRATAESLMDQWKKSWLSHRPYSMGTGDQNVGTSFARALACTGHKEEALAELERIVGMGYHAGGWRDLNADHAYDGVRSDRRFEALLDRLRGIAEAERQRFLDRPDLADGDIEGLASADAAQ